MESSFVTVAIGLDTCAVPSCLRPYLPLLLEMAFKLPCKLEDDDDDDAVDDDDEKLLGKDEFVEALQDETVSYGAALGLLGGALERQVGQARLFDERVVQAVVRKLAGGEGGARPEVLSWLCWWQPECTPPNLT